MSVNQRVCVCVCVMVTKMMLVMVVVMVWASVVTALGSGCYPPFEPVNGQCLYVEYQNNLSWQGAQEYCQSLGGDGNAVDLGTFPTCDSFTAFVRHLAFNGPAEFSIWVGAHTLFTPNMWQWVTGEALQTGVPYWAYTEDYDGTHDCAATDSEHYHRLMDQDCAEQRGFVCTMAMSTREANSSVASSAPVSPDAQVVPIPVPEIGCHDNGVQVGDFCYVIKSHTDSWEEAERKCRDEPDTKGGMLFYPQSCEEFTRLAHHLEAEEYDSVYWIGGIDSSGHEEWTWVDGEVIPGGPPYWATGQPSHDPINEPGEHCTAMSNELRYYIMDINCQEHHGYICKVIMDGSVKP